MTTTDVCDTPAADGCPDLSMWADGATARGTDPDVVGAEVIDVVREGIESHPRSAQIEIGPSELGHPCNRWLAHRLAGTVPTTTGTPPWRQAVGTAVHDHFDVWLDHANGTRGTRWLFNLRVDVGELYPGRSITGRLDALDVLTGTVIDLKVPGPTAMKTYGEGKPESPQYRVQTQLYARGAARAGFPVSTVGVLRVPSAGELSQAVWKHTPYDESVAVDALARAGAIAQMVDAIGPGAAPLQTTASHYCNRCPYFSPNTTDLHQACPGDAGWIAKRDSRPDSLHNLIAS